MAKPYIITALDIGSGTIKIVSVLKRPGEPNFEILGQGQEASSGVRRGVVVDIPKATGVISSLIRKIEEESGRKINRAYVTVSGGHISSICSRGLVSVSRADRKISEEDIARALQAAQAVSLPSNKEILDIFPKEFIVDGQGGIKEAAGMEGVRLETDALILCGFSPYLRNSYQTASESGLEVDYLIPAPLASSRAILTSREKELGVCLLDIGAGTTGMSVYEEASLVHVAVFPVGSGHITNDIAICLKTDIDTAERIKIEFGSCGDFPLDKKSKPEKTVKINLEDGEEIVFPKKLLTDIIEARVSEIFDLANKELKKISRQGRLPSGIVLTGGGVKVPGIRELAKKEFKLPCRIGTAEDFPGLQKDPSLSALCGLVLEAVDFEEENKVPAAKNWLKRILNIFIP